MKQQLFSGVPLYAAFMLKELIKCQGFQVAPSELEALLLTYPEISDVAVVHEYEEDSSCVVLVYSSSFRVTLNALGEISEVARGTMCSPPQTKEGDHARSLHTFVGTCPILPSKEASKIYWGWTNEQPAMHRMASMERLGELFIKMVNYDFSFNDHSYRGNFFHSLEQRRVAFEESIRRRKSERDAMDARCKGMQSVFKGNGDPKKEEDMLMLFSPDGVLYYGNIDTGSIKWHHDIKETAYQAMQWDKGPYVDVGEDDNTLHLFSPDPKSSKLIPFNSKEDLQSRLTKIFDKDAKTSYHEYDLYLTQDQGEKRSEGGNNTFKITITDCRCWIADRWSVRYLNAKVLSPCGDENYLELLKVFHSRTVPKFIELCDQLEWIHCPERGF
ncbi:hypothetical protein Tco_0627687 [Tanacetum coccineum]|uniref:Uncharacterized protein n=1 Tax=Tanacetum coccineum TaxID=301880 RepID=A0ABQ4WN71_9ASTR